MRFFRILAMGLAGLVGTPFRTALAALGIVIGVGAVVTLTSLGNGIQKSVSGQITALGPNLITVVPGSSDGNEDPFGASASSTLTTEDTRLISDLPTVRSASSNISAVGLVEEETVSFSGVDPAYREIRAVELSAGRFLEDRGEVVLSESDAERLLEASPEEAVGRTLQIAGRDAAAQQNPEGSEPGQLPAGISPEDIPEGVREEIAEQAAGGEQPENAAPAEDYRVVGVAATEEAGFGPPISQASYLDTQDALDLSGEENVGQILVSATSAENVSRASEGITSEVAAAHGGTEDFTVFTQEELLSTFTEVTDQLNVFLAGIAGISLLVGGIGIMNIMLVSVAERTREIGVRKALGATNGDVLLQFLFEAVLLAALGGAVGIVLGVTASELLPRALPDLPPAVFEARQIAIAFGIAATIGVVFGSLPAYRSARLAPVEALRRE
ncbi:ABC transporter permease [Rubrobacter indicoceani]|uniref:ABC transporter permease n=1 Tax=Rubrobacter indicoceani TaxID=2051957 RepID=UPI000E5AA5FB|nr:ABC transporter permease [Rubrobacter indicoceani]